MRRGTIERGSQVASSVGHGAGSPGNLARVQGCAKRGTQAGFIRRPSAGPRLHAAWATSRQPGPQVARVGMRVCLDAGFAELHGGVKHDAGLGRPYVGDLILEVQPADGNEVVPDDGHGELTVLAGRERRTPAGLRGSRAGLKRRLVGTWTGDVGPGVRTRAIERGSEEVVPQRSSAGPRLHAARATSRADPGRWSAQRSSAGPRLRAAWATSADWSATGVRGGNVDSAGVAGWELKVVEVVVPGGAQRGGDAAGEAIASGEPQML